MKSVWLTYHSSDLSSEKPLAGDHQVPVLSCISFPLKVYLIISRSAGNRVARQPVLAHWPRARERAALVFGGVSLRESQTAVLSRHHSPHTGDGGAIDARMALTRCPLWKN